MPEYQVDVQLWVTVRVEASDRDEAIQTLDAIVGKDAYVEIASRGVEISDGVTLSPACTAVGFNPNEVCEADE